MKKTQVKKTIAYVAGIRTEDVKSDAELREQIIRLDDLDIYELRLFLELEFDVAISDEEMNSWVTVQNVIDSINDLTF